MKFWQRKKAEAAEAVEESTLADRYIAAVEAHRAEKDRFFAQSGHSPLDQTQRDTFEGLAYWPPDPAYQFSLPVQRDDPQTITFQTSDGAEQPYSRLGTISLRVEAGEGTLALYEDESGGLFLPFRDSTSGTESYGAGRYLEPQWIDDTSVLVDFNLAYNPFCAYSYDYSCPLPPLENWLQIPIRAGEKAFVDGG
ncbi:MAG: DUF1684 domain-containing protein [Ardenticatenales bacterium]|nr:DUF1684 domain-containing protein [Ardenticatenales bacterium]